MVHRGVAGRSPLIAGGRRLLVLAALLVATLLVVHVDRAGADDDYCTRFAADSQERAAQVTGEGRRILVIGDSWSVGLGLEEPERSWPSRLDGQVRVAGFSGSGFSAHASACADVSFADRAPRGGIADLVVVAGGLNDVDQSDADIRAGYIALMEVLTGRDVVVVGPATAPRRATGVGRVDALLARLSERYAVPYIRTTELELSYLDDRLHLTDDGHEEFGDYVAGELAALG